MLVDMTHLSDNFPSASGATCIVTPGFIPVMVCPLKRKVPLGTVHVRILNR